MAHSDAKEWFRVMMHRIRSERIDSNQAVEEFKTMLKCYGCLDETVEKPTGKYDWHQFPKVDELYEYNKKNN